jgi:hypothetical protein
LLLRFTHEEMMPADSPPRIEYRRTSENTLQEKFGEFIYFYALG